ncbi:energy transducer TonB [Oligoflexus tunisiensis]|uniref:energy transducer TonB n=1 Tax=Oligoflexus tunisiensis TaxID=708132 RepID=UPI00114CFE6E|nr:TonB C-terminal domain-containing protein [Oligoflexus tunisiensis]
MIAERQGMEHNATPVKLDSLYQRGRRLILLPLTLSLLVHALILLILSFLPAPDRTPKSVAKVPVRLEIKEVPRQADKEKSDKKDLAEKTPEEKTIIEAPLPETEAPTDSAYLGAQDHKTAQEMKTQPRPSAKAADPTPLQNGPLRLKVEEAPGGKVKVPAGKDYKEFLPKQIDVMNTGHNDYIDKKMPVGPVLDVNTTEYRFIGYFTSVRKQVDLAYYDIGPTLQDKDYIREKVENIGKAHLQGTSVIQLTVARSGLLIETKLVQSSGDKDVDEFWERVLNLAAPYPPLPRDFPEEELVFTYKLYYDFVIAGDRRTRRFMF